MPRRRRRRKVALIRRLVPRHQLGHQQFSNRARQPIPARIERIENPTRFQNRRDLLRQLRHSVQQMVEKEYRDDDVEGSRFDVRAFQSAFYEMQILYTRAIKPCLLDRRGR